MTKLSDKLKKTKLICDSCEIAGDTVRERTVKENGVLGYYDVKVKWCDKCTNSHNYYLMASWGQE